MLTLCVWSPYISPFWYYKSTYLLLKSTCLLVKSTSLLIKSPFAAYLNMFLMQKKRFLDGLLLMDPPFKREVHDAAVPRVVKLGRIESLGNIWRDQEVWPEGRWAGRWMLRWAMELVK